MKTFKILLLLLFMCVSYSFAGMQIPLKGKLNDAHKTRSIIELPINASIDNRTVTIQFGVLIGVVNVEIITADGEVVNQITVDTDTQAAATINLPQTEEQGYEIRIVNEDCMLTGDFNL